MKTSIGGVRRQTAQGDNQRVRIPCHPRASRPVVTPRRRVEEAGGVERNSSTASGYPGAPVAGSQVRSRILGLQYKGGTATNPDVPFPQHAHGVLKDRRRYDAPDTSMKREARQLGSVQFIQVPSFPQIKEVSLRLQALTALKFKPVDKSCAAYALELRSLFSPSSPAAPTSDGSWKTHALALEKDLRTLKEKYETEQLKVLTVNSAHVGDTSDNQPSNATAKKKKPAEKYINIPARPDLETILGDLTSRSEFASLPASDFSALQQLTSALSSSSTASQRTLLLSTATHALIALASILHPIIRTEGATTQAEPRPASYGVNKLLDVLITHIFQPLLESFVPLSDRYLATLFLPTNSVVPADLRPDVLHLFQSALSPLVAEPSPYDANLRGSLSAHILRELEALFPPRTTDAKQTRPTRDSRVKALARKDSLWYLCTCLHLLFGSSKDCPTSGSAPSDRPVAERRILDALSRIVTRCHNKLISDVEVAIPISTNPADDTENTQENGIESKHPLIGLDMQVIDEVGYGMILGVVERYWRWTADV
ncbi:hypothetical protein C8J57DRAFT_1553603 [Mycena rebaudengoi]|nr:hypothetical protein C8J57DRAFT_1553603 [Mycena rebaudengoi]